jgi:hypothetical protein
MEKSLPMAATGDRRNIVTEASMNEMKAMKETMPTGRGRHVQTSLHDFMAKHMKSPEAEVLPSL